MAKAYESYVVFQDRVSPAANCSGSSPSEGLTTSKRPISSLHAKRTKEAEQTSPFPGDAQRLRLSWSAERLRGGDSKSVGSA